MKARKAVQKILFSDKRADISRGFLPLLCICVHLYMCARARVGVVLGVYLYGCVRVCLCVPACACVGGWIRFRCIM
jgi:hypothetical protein